MTHYIVDGETYRRKKASFVALAASALHPYGQDTYRVAACNIAYDNTFSNAECKYAAFTVLATNSQAVVIKCGFDAENVDQIHAIRKALNAGNPIVIKLGRLTALSYKYAYGSGISMYSDSCELVKIDVQNLSREEVAYYTGPVNKIKVLGNVDVYLLQQKKYITLPITGTHGFYEIPIVNYLGVDYKAEYMDIARNIPVCKSVVCTGCLNKFKRKDCRYESESRNIVLAIDA